MWQEFFFPSFSLFLSGWLLNIHQTWHVCDTEGARDEMLTRQGGTERLMGKGSLEHHSYHVHTAIWLPQVFVFTHEEHLNIELLQKHVSALTHLSVILQRFDNGTSAINVKLGGCANLPQFPAHSIRLCLPTCRIFSIIYEPCHFPCQKHLHIHKHTQSANFDAHSNLVL